MIIEYPDAADGWRPANYWDRYLAAGQLNTPVQDLYELALDAQAAIRARVAQNPKVPPQLMMILLSDPNAEVRVGLSENPKAPFFILQRLAIDEDIHVRYDMAENPRTPEILLRRLMNDDNPYVALRAVRTVNAMYSEPPQSLPASSHFGTVLATA